jgi:exodeoxyribonuclease VII large subunit
VAAEDRMPLGRPDALTIGELYNAVEGALARAFPRGGQLWVRGEVQSITDRTGHCYIDLVDPDGVRARDTPVLKVKCWRRTWEPVKRLLADQGVGLEVGTVVVLGGRLDFYRARGEIDFIVAEVDVHALLGRLAAKRAALVKALTDEGLIDRNRRRAVPAVPLRIGLVASPGTEGYRDFMGRLDESGFAFHVRVAPVPVQGPSAPTAVTRGVATLSEAGCELVVIVRGGGSKADLATFDREAVARTVAGAPVPVWTGIGHTGDQSVTDIVANRSFVTPTECGQELVGRVGQFWASVRARSDTVTRRCTRAVDDAARRDSAARTRLAAATRNQMHRHADRLAQRAARVAALAPRSCEEARRAVGAHGLRLGPAALAVLDRRADATRSVRRLLAAYDVERQLERGYTITYDDAGHIVRSVAGVVPGAVLETRFADGRRRSVAETP